MTDKLIRWGIAILSIALITMCVAGCKKDDPRTIQFRLNKGHCEFEIWEYRSAPKEANVYRTGTHTAPYSDYLPYKPGYTYMFTYYATSGQQSEGEILLDGRSVGKSTNNSVTYK